MTSECIDSVIEHTKGLNYEIILVDNASTDGSKEFFAQDKRVKYIYSANNQGFGAGNNLGVNNANGKYVFLLNSDTLFVNNAIKMLYDFSEAYTSPCVCGAWLIDKKGNPSASKIKFPRMNVLEFMKSFIDKSAQDDYNSTTLVDNVCGADMFMPRQIYQLHGGFDERIFLYEEEVEFQYRLKKNGISRILVSGPRIIHFGGGSGGNWSATRLYSHFYFLKKHMSPFNYYCARMYYGLNYGLRMFRNQSVKLCDIFQPI
ncbi:MAG: glycosyltransferase family 2 protein [Clostridium sp.]|nr:glycosyltransferase family 2 protein [Clostridium sp.]